MTLHKNQIFCMFQLPRQLKRSKNHSHLTDNRMHCTVNKYSAFFNCHANSIYQMHSHLTGTTNTATPIEMQMLYLSFCIQPQIHRDFDERAHTYLHFQSTKKPFHRLT